MGNSIILFLRSIIFSEINVTTSEIKICIHIFHTLKIGSVTYIRKVIHLPYLLFISIPGGI